MTACARLGSAALGVSALCLHRIGLPSSRRQSILIYPGLVLMELSAFRRLIISLLVVPCVLFAFPLLSAQDDAPPPSADSSKYVGVEVCQGCHEDAYNSFMKSHHVETLKSKNVATLGCEGCHGPGASHVSAGGDPDQIERYAGAKPEVILGRCERCHQAKISKQHVDAHLSCLTCHSAHHARPQTPLLVKPAPELCRSCHHDR
jgi:predicted CXXCH cytochrome family protein